jgi:hypothetical protein
MYSCSICRHPARRLIEMALAEQRPHAEIRGVFVFDTADAGLHGSEHMTEGNRPGIMSTAPDVLREAQWLTLKLTNNAANSDPRLALAGVHRLESQIALSAKLDQHHDHSDKSEERNAWLQLKLRMFRALENFPEALRALEEALNE